MLSIRSQDEGRAGMFPETAVNYFLVCIAVSGSEGGIRHLLGVRVLVEEDWWRRMLCRRIDGVESLRGSMSSC